MKNREGRVTPENITELKDNEIFVFGSNESGIHKAGAAKIATESFGAKMGIGYGPTGKCFAIPTKSWEIKGVLPQAAIECFVGRFSEYCLMYPDKKFLVTKIGCGLAGYKPEDIAPIFAAFDDKMFSNVSLPQEFWDVIDKVYREELVEYLSIKDDGEKNELSNV
jgi:hypothetical protein